MFRRILNPLKSRSFFLFGARGTGKSTFINQHFHKSCHYINLLESKWEYRYSAQPDLLSTDILALESDIEWVVIDEIQKVPKLLDIVHNLIESKRLKFILSGSSARKLKKNSANLLAGRAFNYQMFPLTFLELGDKFDLETVLRWGSLPNIYSMTEIEREEFLRSYAQTYLREEILQEQIVRNGLAFRQFLEVTAQENGKCLNFKKIARDVGVDSKTVQNYFQILEDTLVGFFLPAFHRSTRKSVKQQPKFFVFDLGVKKALEQSLQLPLLSRTSGYGFAFEHFIICECVRLNSYYRKDYSFYHYATSSGGEVDLVLKRGREVIAVEIKSGTAIDILEAKKLSRVAAALKPQKKFLVSQDPVQTIIEDVICLPWQKFLNQIFVD